MHVEDHPLDYAGFEGIIPPKQYGAGTVMLWDRGDWAAIGDPRSSYRKGRLKFRLQGEKVARDLESRPDGRTSRCREGKLAPHQGTRCNVRLEDGTRPRSRASGRFFYGNHRGTSEFSRPLVPTFQIQTGPHSHLR